MFRKPVFWILFFLTSLAGIFFSMHYFSRAFPVVTLDLRMNRETALEKAAELATRLGLPPAGYRQAASFSGNQKVQNFVELEGGGNSALRQMMAEGLYHPFQWSVRHFLPGETKETSFFFTPGGNPYGFSVKLPEKEAGAALTAEQARAVAEKAASRDWQIDLSRYKLEETSQEVRPGGRIDHTFVYERPDLRVGEGRYRLLLEVGGDRLTGLVPSVKVPEAFSRRYEEMRSSNLLIGVSGSISLVVLYLLGGCGFGLFFLLRQRMIQWRKPILWGSLIAFLQLLAQLNEWPLIWMNYDTAVALPGFLTQQLFMMAFSFFGYAGLFILSFAIAESLTRMAFPDQLQTWRLWSADVAGSKAVLGQTVGGYLLVGIFFAYEVLLYFLANRSLGWWSPSDSLVQPDILAHYLPWLNPIAISAQAGFWEECLFRAVPLAGAALLGTRFGRRTWWLAGAMLVQAIIFGAGHAGYANQPSYARLIELIIPSLMFGGIYLFFGLLPGIVLHYAFDVVWFALPLFVSSAPGAWWNRSLVILLVLIPLWVAIGGRLRARRWPEIPTGVRNRSWLPEAAGTLPAVLPSVEAQQPVSTMNPLVRRLLPILGLLGLGIWYFVTPSRTDAPALNISRNAAQVLARQTLIDRQVRLPDSWVALPSMVSRSGDMDRFLWQTAGQENYRRLMDDYLTPPHWRVRFVHFEGDVAERAEEYQVDLSESRGAYRFRHLLPEDRPGKSLTEQEARTLAHRELKRAYGLDPALLREVSSVPSKLKARTDWVFTFSDPRPPSLPQGEKRLAVRISGEETGDAYRYIHIPEEWSRQQQDKETIPNVIRTVCILLIVALVIAGIAAAIFSWSRKRFLPSTFLLLFLLLFLCSLSSLLNSIPALVAQFSTAQPYKVQMFFFLGGSIVGILVMSLGIGLAGGLIHLRWRNQSGDQSASAWRLGLSLAGVTAGVSALGAALAPSQAPSWGDFSALGEYFPFLGVALDPVTGFFVQSTIALLLFTWLDRLSAGWTKQKPLSGILLFFFGFAVAGSHRLESLSAWLMEGALLGILLLGSYVFLIRFSHSAVLIGLGLLQVLAAFKQLRTAPFSGNLWGTVLGSLLVAGFVCYFHRQLGKRTDTPEPIIPE